jgi:hypothetical protein
MSKAGGTISQQAAVHPWLAADAGRPLKQTSKQAAKYRSGDQIEKNEMGGANNKYGGQERCIQGFGGET